MASLDSDINTAITDLAVSRERIYVRRTSRTNRYRKPAIYDSGWDKVQYDGFPEGYEPGVDNAEQRADRLISDRVYTGICYVDESDAVGTQLLKMGGRGAF